MFRLSEIHPLCSEVQATPRIIWTFWPQNPENSNSTNSCAYCAYYPWPKQIQKDPKDPNLKFMFTMKLLYTYLEHTAALRWFVSVTLFQALNSPTSSTHRKTKAKKADVTTVNWGNHISFSMQSITAIPLIFNTFCLNGSSNLLTILVTVKMCGSSTLTTYHFYQIEIEYSAHNCPLVALDLE